MKELSAETVELMSQFLTTEHFTLQGAKNATISEANGRLGHYISIVGSSVVALAFVANVSGMGQVFFAFALVIFPILIVLGIVTMIRTIQIGIDYARLTQAINRVRRYYVEITPQAVAFFSFPSFDDPDSVSKSMMPFHSPVQGLASTPGPVILINSILSGVFIGVLCANLFPLKLGSLMIIATIALLLAFTLHMAYSARLWNRASKENLDTRFPAREA